MKFDPAWERPVKAVLDHFNLEDVTIIGASLGGYLAPRAAAFEKRITKVIGWSIFPDFFDILLADDPKALRIIMDSMYRHGHAGVFKKNVQGFSVIQLPRGIAPFLSTNENKCLQNTCLA